MNTVNSPTVARAEAGVIRLLVLAGLAAGARVLADSATRAGTGGLETATSAGGACFGATTGAARGLGESFLCCQWLQRKRARATTNNPAASPPQGICRGMSEGPASCRSPAASAMEPGFGAAVSPEA